MTSIAIMSGGSPVGGDAYRFARRNLDRLTTFLVGFLILWNRDFIAISFVSGDWKIDAFYAAVFDWASIQSAFLFSVYAFFLSRSEPFIQAIASTRPFADLRNFILRTLTLTMGLTIATLPLLVWTPKIEKGALIDPGFSIFLVVAVFLTYSFMCFVKVVRVFRKIERVS